jgi:hypothetical protein
MSDIRGLASWDAIEAYHNRKLAEKDQEIERLKAEYNTAADMYLRRLKEQDKLLTECADALEASWKSPETGEVAPGPMGKLIRRARGEASK